MPRWLAIIVGLLVVCVIVGVIGGRYVVDRVQNEVSEPVIASIAQSVEASVTQSIKAENPISGEIHLSQSRFDINTIIGPAGESGFEVTTSGTESEVIIYGARTQINQGGIAVALADIEYHALPVVRDGRIEFEDSSTDRGVTGWLLDPETIEEGFETGLNDALWANDLVPVTVELSYGQLTIRVETVS